MNHSSLETNTDLEEFAQYMGFSGIDTDVFYESYHQLDNEEYEYDYESIMDESYEGNY